MGLRARIRLGMPRQSPSSPRTPSVERAALVGLRLGRVSRGQAERHLEELSGLAEAAGARVALRVLQERDRPDAATLIGAGKVQTVAAACDEVGVDVVIVDNELSPAQLRNLEKALGRRVVDRTQLILDIFARRARTREGKLQVELAQLRYLLPRLVGARLDLSRLGGGIGTRGPGETKLETARGKSRRRIAALGEDLDDVRRRRVQLRERRQRADVPTVALVGYTNAGKTTLFNLVTQSAASVSNALFVTLDPLVRRVRLPDRRQLLISDTVGFIDRLPHSLVAAFRATLEEVAEADLLVHVIDAASDDRDEHVDAVRRVLDEVGAGDVPTLDVYNKCDKLSAEERERLQIRYPAAILISALRGTGQGALVDAIVRGVTLDTERVTLHFEADRPEHRARIAALYRQARVLTHVAENGTVAIEADVPRRVRDRWTAAKRGNGGR